MTASQQPGFKIPKNLCQVCFERSGRYILDCYCIICEDCYRHSPPASGKCNLCGRPTKGNKIDAKQESSIKRISHLFESMDSSMQKMLEVHKFQSEITNRYCQYLTRELANYQAAVNQLIGINPGLASFFNSRLRGRKSVPQTQQQDRNHSMKAETTVKPTREYGSEVFQSRRSTLELGHRNSKNPRGSIIGDVRPIGARATNQNHSGNVIYKVPNINVNTAIRSNERVLRGQEKIRHDESDEVGSKYAVYRRF